LKKAHQDSRSAQALEERINTLESNIAERDKEIKRVNQKILSFLVSLGF
jgi:uncharacterized coiled-coil protein SlyX